MQIQLEDTTLFLGNFYKEYTLTFMMFFVNLLCFCILVFFGILSNNNLEKISINLVFR